MISRIIKKICIVTFITVNFISCSKETNENTSNNNIIIKPKKYTVKETGSSAYSVNFEYNGNMITKIITSFGRNVTINYNSNNQITNYINQTGSNIETFNATYSNDLLTELKNNTNTERTLYYYDSNKRVNKTDYFENNFLQTTFYQYDTSGNVNQSNDLYSSFQYEYDSSSNPFKNVIPQMDAEIFWPWFGNLINNQILVKEKLSSSTTYSTKYTYIYEYNAQNYPTKRTQKNPNGLVTETVTYEY